MSFSVPILVIAFNRPGPAAGLLQLLRELQPSRLYLAFDGPRPGRSGEAQLCQAVRDLFRTGIDWPCETAWLEREWNLGCRQGVSSAIDWLFEHVEEGIILEDDVHPLPGFFRYCAELLEHYRHDTRIGSITANTYRRVPQIDQASYYFSIYSRCWGWATWKRAWAAYHQALPQWPVFRQGGWLEQLGGAAFARRSRFLIDQVDRGEVDTWDYIWQLACWQQGFLTCSPCLEQAVNVGFGADATHTQLEASPLFPAQELTFPLIHPTVFLPHGPSDRALFEQLIRPRWSRQVRQKLVKALHRLRGQ